MDHIRIEGVTYTRQSEVDRIVRERMEKETDELRQYCYRADRTIEDLQKSYQHWRKIAEAKLKHVTVIMQDNLARWHQQGHELTVAVDSHNPERVAWFVDGVRYVPAEDVEPQTVEE